MYMICKNDKHDYGTRLNCDTGSICCSYLI